MLSQSNPYVKTSSNPRSVAVTVMVALEPSLFAPPGDTETMDGFKLITVTMVERVAEPPSPSVTRTLTWMLPLSPKIQVAILPDWLFSKMESPLQSNS